MRKSKNQYLILGAISFVCGMLYMLPAYVDKEKEAFQAMTMLDTLGYKLYDADKKGAQTTRIWIKTVY